MWSSIRSTEVPVTKVESTAKVRYFVLTCNIIKTKRKKLTRLNEQMTKQAPNYPIFGVSGWDIGNTNCGDGHLLGEKQLKQYRDELIMFGMRMN